MTASSVSRRLAVLLVAGASLLTACSSGSESADTTPAAPLTTLAPESPETAAGLCDYNDDENPISCVENPLAFEDSAEGALERLRTGASWPQDLQYLMYDEAYWAQYLSPTFGPAKLVPGSEMEFYGFYLEALEELPTAFAWQQEWELERGGFVLEQAVLLTTPEDAAKAVELWRAAALAGGLEDVKDVGGPAGSFTTVYIDSSDLYPERRCIAQSLVASGPVVLSVLHLSGGDCRSVPADVPPYLLEALKTRADEIFVG